MVNEKKLNSPRPDFYRQNWFSLDGEWDFSFDDDCSGLKNKWFEKQGLDKKINVPFCYQSELSGINDTTQHTFVWYQKSFDIPETNQSKRVWLNFGAVDYKAVVWVNGSYVGEHQGGHTSFNFEISNFIKTENNIITVYCEDSYNIDQPRGKQHWNEKTDRCWYTATTGIWQSVWLEFTNCTKITNVMLTPNVDEKKVKVKANFSEFVADGELEWLLSFEGNLVKKGSLYVNADKVAFDINIENPDPIDNLIKLWSPTAPNIYDVELKLTKNNNICDEVSTYFGMRKIECRGNKILLNHYPLYQRLVLDQGYWKESLMTPPSVEALIKDVELVQKMGFNGVRKHQKIETPQFLYLADCMGLLVWEEMPSNYEFTEKGMTALRNEYEEMILRDYNHPSIVTWVPLNESWGVRDILWNKDQQNFAMSLYYATKALDSTRIVSTNDGWECVKGDITGIHDYEGNGDVFYEKYKTKEILEWTAVGKMIYSDGFTYEGEPILLSEFGGVAFEDGKADNWGYNDKVTGEEEFLKRVSGLFRAIEKLDYVEGYCYTQLTDVEQETNGLLYPDRTPKVSIEKINEMILKNSLRK